MEAEKANYPVQRTAVSTHGLLPRRHLKSRSMPALENVKLCQQLKDNKPLNCGNTVPEVGLELDSRPCQRWELRKHAESEAVRGR
jgi:hypothetical protein